MRATLTRYDAHLPLGSDFLAWGTHLPMLLLDTGCMSMHP